MTPINTLPVKRRTFLQAAGATAFAASVAGCVDVLSEDGYEDVVLPPPEGHERAADAEIPHPIYGEEIPEVSVSAPLADRTVTTTEFVGDRHALYTFIFTRCPGACPGLYAALRHVQDDAAERGYGDEVVHLPITFDPEHDTPEVLEAYEERFRVDQSAQNWLSLRPATEVDAHEIVEDAFGVGFEKATADPEAGGDHADDHEPNEEDDDGGHEPGDDGDDAHEMAFVHHTLLLLVNKDGYVERAYSGEVPAPTDVVDDVRTVIEGW